MIYLWGYSLLADSHLRVKYLKILCFKMPSKLSFLTTSLKERRAVHGTFQYMDLEGIPWVLMANAVQILTSGYTIRRNLLTSILLY